MIRIERRTNAQVNALNPRGSFLTVHPRTRRTLNLTFAGARNDHYDVTPTTPADAHVLEEILGFTTDGRWGRRAPLRRWRAIEVLVFINGVWVPFGLALRMHGSRMGNANPGPQYPSRSNVMPPGGWLDGGHMCLYASNSVGGAGNAPNSEMSAEANAFARQVQSGQRGGQARAGCFEAEIRGNQLEFLTFLSTLASTGQPTSQSVTPPASPTHPLIMHGSTGPAVRLAQERLNIHGANPQLPITGNFLSMTDTATRAFQRRMGLLVDGRIGENTWVALNANPQATTVLPPQSTGALRVNDIVQFTGDTHFVSATSTSGVRARPGRARVTSLAAGRRNPIHLVREPGGGSDVHGWVQEKNIRRI